MTNQQNLTWKTLFELLGSKSFLDIKTLLLTVMPLMTIASLVASESSSLAELSIWLSGNAIVFAMLTVLVSFLHKIIYSSNPTVVIPIFFVVLISAGLGAIKGFVITSWVRASDPTMMSEIEATGAIIHNTILGVPAVMVASAVSLALAELSQRRVFLAVTQNLQMLRRNSDRNHKKIDSIALKLSELIQKLEDNSTQSVQTKVTDQLRKMLESEIRPLARDLFQHRDREQKAVGILPMSKLAISSRASAIGPAVAMLFFIPHAIGWLGLWSGLAFAFASAVAVFVTISIASRIATKLRLKGPIIHIASAALLPTLVSASILTAITNQAFLDPLLLVFVPIWLLHNSFVISLVREIIHARATTEISALGISTQGQIGEFFRAKKTSKEVAQQLHGSIQSKLLRLIAISKGEEIVSNKEMAKQLREILTLLDQDEKPDRDLKNEILKLQQAWEGFIETEVEVDSLHEVLPIGGLMEIFQELILNSYRHGGAQKISIHASGDTIIASDDGSYTAHSKPGLGSLLFDSVCRDWRMQENERGGTTVELQLQQMLTLDF
jgi:predicted nuclease with TOPRIM domain